MAVIPYSRRMLIEAITRHVANGWPNDSFQPTVNEINLYIDRAVSTNLVGQVYGAAKVSGVLEIPEAYLVTYQLTLTKDDIRNWWFCILPQPPISLPLGYSITDAYFAATAFGAGSSGFAIKNKRRSYRDDMPSPGGFQYWSEGYKVWVKSTDNGSFFNVPFYVQMPSPRMTDLDASMNMPDDAIDTVFKSVVQMIVARFQYPKDIVADNLPAGNKAS